MKKTTKKMYLYGLVFFHRALFFNIALGFAITASVRYSEGMTWIAIAAITFAGIWFFLSDLLHSLWFSMSRMERTFYLAIRRHGHEIPEIDTKEINSKTGQKERKGFFDDADGALEVKMAVNGAVTLINVFVGAHWLMNARKFNKTPQVFKYNLK